MMHIKKLLLLVVSTGILAVSSFSEEFSSKTYETQQIEDIEAKKSMKNFIDGSFGLKPYRVNYILPYGYASKSYSSYIPEEEYKNIEAELQVSLKINVGYNLFGLNEMYYISYTHKAFWQIYTKSSPFRETNYNPDAFVIFPIADTKSVFKLKSLKIAIAHLSNGQGNNEDVIFPTGYTNPGNRSRSVNYFYTTLSMQHGVLLSDLQIWLPLTVNGDLSDNPDIVDYTGYANLKLSYFYDSHMFTLMGRMCATSGQGAIEGTYSYPLTDDVYLYTKLFSGYGESLIDYNNNITKFSVGFSFSR
ncbi:phospholipase A [bacterium]|nr:phospholipase A [bacterium]MBU1991313.1 phospholipase A [bacterium]